MSLNWSLILDVVMIAMMAATMIYALPSTAIWNG